MRSGSIYTGGSPYNNANGGNRKSDNGKVWVGGLALRINPDGTGLKVMGHNFRNSYEVVTDSYGNLWQNDNDDQVVTCRTTWLMEGGNTDYFSTDGTRNWQADQRPEQDIFVAHWYQDDPGVMPAGDRSGAGAPTGIVMNESDALGKNYTGMLLSADAGRNVIFGYRPSLRQSGYHLGKPENFITSLPADNENYIWNDTAQNTQKEKWFRPADITFGTDGALYITDWYDPVVGGHQMKDSIGYGRIFRVAPKNKKLINPKIDLQTTAGRIEALRNPAVNVRNSAFEKLKQQGDAVTEQVKKSNCKKQTLPSHQWSKAMDGFTWRLHPVSAVNDIAQRATDISLSAEERKRMLTALAFINDKAATSAMLSITKSNMANEREQAMYWLSFKQGNDWYPLLDWSKTNLNTVYERKLAAMKVKRQVILDARQSKDERNRRTREMAVDSVGGQLLIGLMAENKLPEILLPVVQKHIFSNADLSVRVQAGKYVKQSGGNKTYSIDAISQLQGNAAAGKNVFLTNCSACHRVGATGNHTGPELTTIRKKFDKVALLDAIINYAMNLKLIKCILTTLLDLICRAEHAVRQIA